MLCVRAQLGSLRGSAKKIIVILFPLALGLVGLGAFFWCMRSGQYADLDGAA